MTNYTGITLETTYKLHQRKTVKVILYDVKYGLFLLFPFSPIYYLVCGSAYRTNTNPFVILRKRAIRIVNKTTHHEPTLIFIDLFIS